MKVGFGGGCHWCTEAVFQALKGVSRVEQGFISSTEPNDFYSEAVIAHYDPQTIALQTLIEIHVRTHASTSKHPLREKYRSAVYYFSDEQLEQTNLALQEIQKGFIKQIITEPLSFVAFRESMSKYKNYYESGPDKPFCKLYIDPKLARIRAVFWSN